MCESSKLGRLYCFEKWHSTSPTQIPISGTRGKYTTTSVARYAMAFAIILYTNYPPMWRANRKKKIGGTISAVFLFLKKKRKRKKIHASSFSFFPHHIKWEAVLGFLSFFYFLFSTSLSNHLSSLFFPSYQILGLVWFLCLIAYQLLWFI